MLLTNIQVSEGGRENKLIVKTYDQEHRVQPITIVYYCVLELFFRAINPLM